MLGSNGSGKSHFLRLLAAGGSDPDREHQPVGDIRPAPVEHAGRVRARVAGAARAGSRRPTTTRRCTGAPCSRSCTAATTTAPGCRASSPPARSTATAWRKASEQTFDSLSGGQQARLQILLLELSGATLLLLDEPTDNLDLHSAEALEDALDAFEGTVLAVTHDRWFARGFDRFLVFRADGRVVESDEPVWDEGRVSRAADALTSTPHVTPGRLSRLARGVETGVMDPQRNKERTLDAVAALNRGDVEGYLAIYAPGAVVHGLPEHVTPDASGHRARAHRHPPRAARLPGRRARPSWPRATCSPPGSPTPARTRAC